MRRHALALLTGLALATPAAAQPAARTTVTEKKPVTIVVDTPRHGFHPQVIRMPGGVPVRLVVTNPSGSDHDFTAPEFFATAQVNDADAHVLEGDRIEVPKYSSVSIRLIARPGHYDLKSTKALDLASGMQGQILVF